MAYKRKTRDEWDILANYGYGDGWEVVNCELTRRDANRSLKEHRENHPQAQYKAKKMRVHI